MKKIIIFLLAIAILASLSACTSESNAAPVTTTEAVQKETIDVFGVVSASVVKNIILDFQAPITRIHVSEGERVSLGMPLISLDRTEMETTITMKELSLAAAKKDTDRLLENTDIKKLTNDLKNARAISDKSEKELAIKQQLYEAGSISLSDLEGYKKQADSDKKDIQDINYSIESLKNNKGSQNDRINLEASTIEADLKLLYSKLSKSYLKESDIISDIQSGVVYDIGYAEGDIAGPQKKLLSILSLDSLEVEADIPEEFYKDICIGSVVTVTPVADRTRMYTGRIKDISSKATENNGETQIPVKISIDNVDDFLLPGFNVDISIQINT